MSPQYFARRTIVFFAIILVLLSIFGYLQIWRKSSLPKTADTAAQIIPGPSPAEAAAFSPVNKLPDKTEQQRHLALLGEVLCIYAGPIGGGGELLQKLDIPLRIIPARWLAQLTTGGIEFADEESLLMALDNLDELAN